MRGINQFVLTWADGPGIGRTINWHADLLLDPQLHDQQSAARSIMDESLHACIFVHLKLVVGIISLRRKTGLFLYFSQMGPILILCPICVARRLCKEIQRR